MYLVCFQVSCEFIRVFRYLVNLYNVIGRELLASGVEAAVFPIWILCDGSTTEHMAWMSSHITFSSKTDMATIDVYTISAEG